MACIRIQPKMNVPVLALLLTVAAAAQTSIPATGLCNTGLTAASPLPEGCTTSTPVTPVNPESGGSSVDGNWQLATPYPSAPSNEESPNPCTLTTFGPAWIDAPWPSWIPNDGTSQWITPEVIAPSAPGGWYMYRTVFTIPPIQSGDTRYVLSVAGQLLVDNDVAAIFVESPAGYNTGCRAVSKTIFAGFQACNTFSFATTVLPHSRAFLYVAVYNAEPAPENPTGLRVEFTSANLTPE